MQTMKLKLILKTIIAAIMILALATGCAGNAGVGAGGGNGIGIGIGNNEPQSGNTQTALTSDNIIGFYFYYPSGNMPDSSYEIAKEEGGFVLKQNTFEWYGSTDVVMYSDEYEIDENALRDLHEIILFYNIASWNGFDKKAEDRDMTSANMRFVLEIVYDDQTRILAQGDHVFPDGYKEAEKALLDFFEHIITIKQEEALQKYEEEMLQEKEGMLKDVSNIKTIFFSYGNFLDEDIPQYEINSTDEGLELTFRIFDTYAVIDTVSLSGAEEQDIISIYDKHDAFSWDGFNEKIDGSTDFISINDIFIDSRGRMFNFIVYGIGAEPEGYAAFRDEITEYFDSLLGH